jgi:hypothetical protein
MTDDSKAGCPSRSRFGFIRAPWRRTSRPHTAVAKPCTVASDRVLSAPDSEYLRSAVENVLMRRASEACVNTTRQNRSRQIEFQGRCGTEAFGDGDLVHEVKVVAFLDEVVIPRSH